MQRYYIDARMSSYGCYPSFEHLKNKLKMAGAKNIRFALRFGWSNQDRVATFSCDQETRDAVEADLDRGLIIYLHWNEKTVKNCYLLSELKSLPTLFSGHDVDLKVETNADRVWLVRLAPGDGSNCNNVIEERLSRTGEWVLRNTYRAV